MTCLGLGRGIGPDCSRTNCPPGMYNRVGKRERNRTGRVCARTTVLAIQVLPLDTLFECLKEHASDLGGQAINLFQTAAKKSKSDLLDYYLRPNLLSPGQSYIYIAEDKGGKGSRPNYDPGNTIVAAASAPDSGIAFPSRWGLFTNPLGWVEVDTAGPRPSDRPINVGFCVYTLEFDKIPLSEQLRAIWDGGLSRADEA